MKRSIILLMIVTGMLLCSACGREDSAAQRKEWPQQKALYEKGYQDAFEGKPAREFYQNNEYYSSGYSAGADSAVIKDETI
jgi:hypothetical protein